MTPAVVVLGAAGGALACRIAECIGGDVHGLARRVPEATVRFEDAGAHLAMLFAAGRPIVGLCAAGILIRCLAHLLTEKAAEPPVVAVAADATAVVPLVGGHRGANLLARRIGELLGVAPAITTASDGALGIVLDEPPAGYRLAEGAPVREVAARILSGAGVRIIGRAAWLDEVFAPGSDDAGAEIVVDEHVVATAPARLVYHPATLALGVGAERGADPAQARDLVSRVLRETGLAPASIALVASLDLKEDEPAIHSVSEMIYAPARFFTAERLETETPRLANPSDAVYRAVGCHGVAEAAALAAAGPHGGLVAAKTVGARVTCAIARAPAPIDPARVGRARARLAIVGLGPGAPSWRTGEADQFLAAASDLVGYGLYLDLAGPARDGQRRHAFALGEEAARVRHALDLAAEGRDVALISSGDPGIYAMAALAFEMIEVGPPAWRRIAVTVAPGISALQAAAARVGAPLGHDFCAISLSDLMTPDAVIRRRLEAAATADFVVALYNPASQRRRALLDHALDTLARHRPPDTPVVVARDLGRPGEHVTVSRLDSVDRASVDMLTLLLVGASTSRAFRRGDGSQVVYTPRGYQAGPA